MVVHLNGLCPKDNGILVSGAGSLGEDICRACQSRFLGPDITQRVFRDYLQVREELLHELSRTGFRKWVCPNCAQKMTTTWVRGLEIELCSGCGGSFLDAGELHRLGKGLWPEVEVSSAATSGEVASGTPAGARSPEMERGLARLAHAVAHPDGQTGASFDPAIQVGVFCTYCEAQLALDQVNWLVEGRPWCPRCASPFVSMWARLLEPLQHLGTRLMNLFLAYLDFRGASHLRAMRRRLLVEAYDSSRSLDVPPSFSSSHAPTLLQKWGRAPRHVDFVRVAPDDAVELLGPFFELLPRRAYGRD